MVLTILSFSLKAGWLIPIATLFVHSFSPLFVNEVVHILVGIVWDLEIGFGIVTVRLLNLLS